VILALVATMGGHWALLQTVAWTTMLANNLHATSLPDAVAHTFDGKHPCCLCKAIATGKQSEQKHDGVVPLKKLEFLSAKEPMVLVAPEAVRLLPLENSSLPSRSQPPLLQPPRTSIV